MRHVKKIAIVSIVFSIILTFNVRKIEAFDFNNILIGENGIITKILLRLEDLDNDGLSNKYEEIIGTNKYNSDTDGDKLSDGFEVDVAKTNPLKANSYQEDLSDAEVDIDEDGLTNLEEFKFGTDPRSVDTDWDNINDNDEIKIYKTNPLKRDTDEDGIYDSFELELGTNPINSDTDDNGVIDGEETFMITKSPTEDETDKRLVPTIEFNIKGKLLKDFSIEKIPGDDYYLPKEMPGYIGAAYNLKFDEKFESAKLKFEFNKELFNIKDFVPAIYYVDIIEQEMILPKNQKIDRENGTIVAEIDIMGRYIMLNKTEFQAVFDPSIRPPS